jgi:hypothetical protein
MPTADTMSAWYSADGHAAFVSFIHVELCEYLEIYLMYYHTPPTGLYGEYQARVDAALRKYHNAQRAQPVAQPRALVWLRFRHWLSAERERLIRQLQPAEEGYIA